MTKALFTKILLAGGIIGTVSATSPLIRVVNSGGERLEGEASKLFNISDSDIENAKGVCWVKGTGEKWKTNLPEELRTEWVKNGTGTKKELSELLKKNGNNVNDTKNSKMWEKEAEFTVGFTFKTDKNNCKSNKEPPAAWFETKVIEVPYLFAIEWERSWNNGTGFMGGAEWQAKRTSKEGATDKLSEKAKKFLEENNARTLFEYFSGKVSTSGAWVVTTKQ